MEEISKSSDGNGTYFFTFKATADGTAKIRFTYTEDTLPRSRDFTFNISDEDYDEENTVNITKGDTNCDGKIDLADVILIMQALANPNKYGINGTAPNHLTEQGQLNGDVDSVSRGLTGGDALKIQKYLLGLITDLDSEE